MVRRAKAAQISRRVGLSVLCSLEGPAGISRAASAEAKAEYDAARVIQGMFKRSKARALITTLIQSVMQKKYDPESKRYYYENSITGEVMWTKPRLLKNSQDLSEDITDVWTCATCGYARNAMADVEQMGVDGAECRLCYRPYADSVKAQREAEEKTEEGMRRALEARQKREEEEAMKPVVPNAPEDCNAQAGDGKALVWWAPGAEQRSRNQKPVDGYLVIKQRLDGGAWKDKGVTEVDAGVTRVTIEGCSNGRTYRFVVRARSAVGLSVPSEPSQEIEPNPILPRGWRMIKGDDEKIFYYNEETKQRTFERPTKDVYWVSEDTQRAVDFSPNEISELRARFREIDTDESGGIDRHELKVMVKDLGIKNCPPKRLRALFAEADADKSGTIDFNEFVLMLHKIKTGEISGFGQLMSTIGGGLAGARSGCLASATATARSSTRRG